MIARVICLIMVFASVGLPVFAADWSRYVNPRFGAAADVPPGFSQEGPAEVNGEGRKFRAANGRASVTVWGGHTISRDFSQEMRTRISTDEAEGWALTYRSEPPDWAAWGGTRAGFVFYAKSISTCGGNQTANVRLHYPAADIPDFDAIANRLGRSLAQDGGCF